MARLCNHFVPLLGLNGFLRSSVPGYYSGFHRTQRDSRPFPLVRLPPDCIRYRFVPPCPLSARPPQILDLDPQSLKVLRVHTTLFSRLPIPAGFFQRFRAYTAARFNPMMLSKLRLVFYSPLYFYPLGKRFGKYSFLECPSCEARWRRTYAPSECAGHEQ